MTEAVRCDGVGRTYADAAATVAALKDVSFAIAGGELIALVGRSGSGKTTLLGLVGGLDRPDQGHITVCGRDLGSLDELGLVEHRRRTVGFVFQAAGLVPLMTAAENVALALELAGSRPDQAAVAAAVALERVGLAGRAKHRAYELSGGEQQRVALARALVKHPPVIVADEPTGQLDSETAVGILALLREVADGGTAVLVATHDEALAERADRVLLIDDGRVRVAAALPT